MFKNNKTVKIGKERETHIDLPKIMSFLRVNDIIENVIFLGFIGGENAYLAGLNCGALSAFICTLFPSVTASFVYPDFNQERCDFEMIANAKISLFQIAQFVF